MQYRPEVDGLRAIAVLPVILFHAGFSAFSGGFVGVDIFFVISGYLITTIIYQEIAEGRFSIWRFYERRARRILPALLVVCLVSIPFAWSWMLPNEFKDFSQSLVGVTTFTSNILFWRESGYFADPAELKPLLHTWSLAVEEQFYILYPPLLLFLYRLVPKHIFLLISLGALASLGLAHFASLAYPGANFYLLPSRAWELGVGALVALHLQRSSSTNTQTETVATNTSILIARRSVCELLGLLGLILIAYSIFTFDEATPFPSLWTLIPVIGTALIIFTADRYTLVGRLLSLRLLVGIGLLSYSAYLWHQPLFAFARIRLYEGVPDWTYWILIISTFALAWLTWFCIEIPARRRLKLPRVQVLSGAVVSCLTIGTVGGVIWASEGVPNRTSPSGVSFSRLGPDAPTMVNQGLSSTCDGSFTLSSSCRTGDDHAVMVWGDSYAMHLVQALTESDAHSEFDIIQFTKSSCAPIFGLAKINEKLSESWAEGCISFNNSVREWLDLDDKVEYVIMSSPMNIIQSQTYDDNGNIHHKSEALILEGLNDTAIYLRSIGKKPVLISPPPRTGEDLSRCVIGEIFFGSGPSGTDNCNFTFGQISDDHNQVSNFLESPDLNIPVVNLEDYICDIEIDGNNACRVAFGDINIFRDTGHLSHAGSAIIGRMNNLLEKSIEAADNFQPKASSLGE